jgi:hypothetical protein
MAQDGTPIAPLFFGFNSEVKSIGSPVVIGEGGAGGPVYRMRGIDATLMRTVFWNSSVVDVDATDYTGPGNPTDIVVQAIIGAE